MASISRTALWYVPADRVRLYKSFGYTDARGVPDPSLRLPQGAPFADVDAAVVAELARCAAQLAPLLDELAAALAAEGLDFTDKSTSVLE